MSAKRNARQRQAGGQSRRTPHASLSQRRAERPRRGVIPRLRSRAAAGIGVLVVVVALAAGSLALLTGSGAQGHASPSQWTVQAAGGTYTSVNPDRLAQMLASKDFTFVNVKTPYYGEIDRTDLFIPYNQIAAQASKLPQDRAAKIVVYCRSGVESAQAAQTLVSLGYTNVWNLDGGMVAWENSGRQLLHKQ